MRQIEGRIEAQGPFLMATAMASHQHVSLLKQANRPAPPPITIRGLIDTGASCSAIDSTIVVGLGLIQTGRSLLHTPTTGSAYVERDQYDVSLLLGSQPGEVKSFTVGALRSDFVSEGFEAVIGWDILKYCVLTCHGPSMTFRLTY
jgi:hypothetical protein